MSKGNVAMADAFFGIFGMSRYTEGVYYDPCRSGGMDAPWFNREIHFDENGIPENADIRQGISMWGMIAFGQTPREFCSGEVEEVVTLTIDGTDLEFRFDGYARAWVCQGELLNRFRVKDVVEAADQHFSRR